ncbi:MAG: hypothetical protein ACUVXB_07665 [Bryobacteraceae bacterium]
MRVRLNWRTLAYLLSGMAVIGLAIYRLAGPQGIRLLIEKHREIRTFEKGNLEIERELKERLERLRRLEEDSSEVEAEIRKQWRLQKKDETTFLLPEPKK